MSPHSDYCINEQSVRMAGISTQGGMATPFPSLFIMPVALPERTSRWPGVMACAILITSYSASDGL